MPFIKYGSLYRLKSNINGYTWDSPKFFLTGPPGLTSFTKLHFDLFWLLFLCQRVVYRLIWRRSTHLVSKEGRKQSNIWSGHIGKKSFICLDGKGVFRSLFLSISCIYETSKNPFVPNEWKLEWEWVLTFCTLMVKGLGRGFQYRGFMIPI